MTYWIITVAIVAIALCVIAVVAVGMRGSLADRAPDVANVLANTARHLNGDAEPPQALVDFFGEIPRSAASARSAMSARSAPSASEPPTR
ncbi:MAG: hypothetical protein LCH87_09625 [Actinobacteria bacterium]|uniref:hypothetical protein n=1 Tax=Propionicimonas sp. T2.31MG-18 TaxID=3157620 RepID=UPI0035E51F2E|nr:hypothetical protein [Actinomycetota bacterium]MCA0307601.1 hypothetical protein [Actinomycetota bacterium]